MTVESLLLAGLLLLPFHVEAQLVSEGGPVFVIGALDGPQEQTIGKLEDVVRDSLGRVFVLDGWGAGVTWFDSLGTLGGQIGTAGQGPGELRNPRRMALDEEGHLHVLDVGNGRIVEFAFGDSILEAIDHTRIDGLASDICLIGSRLFLLSPRASRVVREIDENGETKASFADQVRPDKDLMQDMPPESYVHVNQGYLICDSARDQVIHASGIMGVVRAYSTDGELNWRRGLEDFRRQELRGMGDMGCCVFLENPESGTFMSVNGLSLNEDLVAVSTHEFIPRAEDPESQYGVRWLRAADGVETGREEVRAVIVGFWKGRPFGVRYFPWPSVHVF